MTTRIAVEARNVSMVYKGKPAVNDASFVLETGKFLTILGPSGSGKTTLLRMIAGFQAPTQGDILIAGKSVGAVPPHARSIGMVFQKLALFPHMNAEENVAFPLKMRRHDARKIPAKVAQFLDLVRLGDFGKRRIHELSGGQQQRVAIARALVFEPELLLLDEPLAALDRKLREEMQLEFRRIQRELGVTTINVTHDQREALVLSDEIIVMDKGEIQQSAQPSETYHNPTNPFVANFIGVTNFLPGKVTGVNGATVAFDCHGVAMTGQAAKLPPTPGQAVDGALRAEQIRSAATPAGLPVIDTRIEGQVADVIFEGERIVYDITIAQLAGQILRVFGHDPLHHTQFALHQTVYLGWNTRDILIFDR